MRPIPDTGLPIEAAVPDVRSALASRGLGVLVAPPGSGKTTVVPLRLLHEMWLADRKIVVLEPRRLATRAAARRMAHLVGDDVGATVGYVTRDDRRTSAATRIEVVTEGVLTRRLQRDPELPGVGLLVFDEVHERNLQTDLGLALTLDVRGSIRPDLALLVMSATIDADRIAGLLGGDDPAPVVTADARLHPVEVRWVPARSRGRRPRLDDHVASVVRRATGEEHGDVLAFLPGMADMLRVRDRLSGLDADVRLLHGSLPPAEQDLALAPTAPGRRRIVLATDIAESSLTVEGVRIVVDSGLAKSPRYDPRTGMTRLQTVPISRASADQRAGRAGRVEPGVAYRLWSKLEQGGRAAHIVPEIAQVDLAGLALELAVWGAEPEKLPFLDPPPGKAWRDARALLARLGALDEAGHVTDMGRLMVGLPLHPRLGRMIVDAGADAALACVLAALVDERDVLRGRPDERPVDLTVRTRLVLDPAARHPLAVGAAIGRVRRSAADLARRAGIGELTRAEPHHSGRVLALAYPDRLAMRRGSPGRFQLRTGTTAFVPPSDPLAIEAFLVPADLDGKRKDARIRLAAPIDAVDVAERFSDQITEQTRLKWDGDRLFEHTERRLGGVALDSTQRRPHPSPDVTSAVLDRLRERRLDDLSWGRAARSLVERVTFLHSAVGDPWPDWSREALTATVEEWLGPHLPDVSGLDDVARVDLVWVLRSHLRHRLVAELDRLAPTHVTVPSGRRIAVDYSDGVPTVPVKVQEMYGATRGPQIGGQPVRLQLLSPAGRPLQITSDLEGFWNGSWQEVRKEMAGRYPKHAWPEDPASARPELK